MLDKKNKNPNGALRDQPSRFVDSEVRSLAAAQGSGGELHERRDLV